MTRKQVCAALRRENATLVDFAAYLHFRGPKVTKGKRDTQARYRAFVVEPAGCSVKSVALGDKKAIDAVIKAYRDAVGAVEKCFGQRGRIKLCRRQVRAMQTHAGHLHKTIWAPVADHIAKGAAGETAWLRIVADDRLGDVPFEAMRDGSGRFLIESFGVRYAPFPALLGAPASLAKAAERSAGRGALVVGDVDYGPSAADPGRLIAQWQRCGKKGCATRPTTDQPAQLAALSRATRSTSAGCGYKADWRRLQTEAVDVAALLGRTGALDVDLVTGQAAIEPLVRPAMANKRVIHLATHGFFANPDACAKYAMRGAVAAIKGKSSGQGALVDISRLSAVVMAGANHGAQAGHPARDGMLDGSEIAAIDLRGTELVALSACETGLGVHFAGEGSLSLARGFLLAGARNVVQSLWQVPSKATSRLFADFYTQLLDPGRGSDVAEALRAAKLNAIARARSRGEGESGYQWAAFVQVGRAAK